MVRPQYVRLEPLLCRRLHRGVERRDDLVAARVDCFTVGGIGALAANQVRQLLADEQVEVRGDVLRVGRGMKDNGIGFGHEQGGIVVLALQKTVTVVTAHVFQNGVASDHDRGVVGYDQRPVFHLIGIGDQVVRRGRLQDRGQDGGLSRCQFAQVGYAEVALGGRGNSVALVAVEVEIQIGGDNRLFALFTGELLSQPDRLDDFLDLPIDSRGCWWQEPLPDELLGNRRGATGATRDGVA